MPSRLVSVVLAEDQHIHWNPSIQQERQTALQELLEESSFTVVAHPEAGAYHLQLAVIDNRLRLEVTDTAGAELCTVMLPVMSFRNTIKEYFAICEAYFDAMRQQQPDRLETIDMARRGLHDDAARQLQARLEDKISIDHATARRLFTLVCVLHLRELA